MNILSLTQPCMIQHVHLSASFCVSDSTCGRLQGKTVVEQADCANLVSSGII